MADTQKAVDDVVECARRLLRAVNGAKVMLSFDENGVGPFRALRDMSDAAAFCGASGAISGPASELQAAMDRLERLSSAVYVQTELKL